MKNYQLSAEAMVMIAGSSAGTQPKYYDHGFWYKINHFGYEGKTEYLASLVLSCSNAESFISYEECMINGKAGCRSKNFLTEDEALISFQRMYDMRYGGSLSERILPMSKVEDRISYVLNMILELTGLDCSIYLSQILALDYLLLNTDRHFHNLGIIANRKTGKFYPAPIFDNGDALLSNYEKFPIDVSTEDNIAAVYGQPFSANLGIQALYAGMGLKLDYPKLESLLSNEPNSRALEVLKLRLSEYRKDFIL